MAVIVGAHCAATYALGSIPRRAAREAPTYVPVLVLAKQSTPFERGVSEEESVGRGVPNICLRHPARPRSRRVMSIIMDCLHVMTALHASGTGCAVVTHRVYVGGLWMLARRPPLQPSTHPL